MTKSPLILKQLELGPMENYIYIVANADTNEAYVIDPAWDFEAIDKELQENNLQLQGALITHGHPDHTNGITAMLDKYDIPVMVSESEAAFYKPIGENIKDIKAGEKISLGHIEIDMVHTPGHTPGSQCFFIKSPKRTYMAANDMSFESENILVAGDTLFLDGCGRCDLPGGDAEVMYDTISNILMKMPENTVIFPGHNYHHYCCDSLENQKQTNPYMQFNNLHSFMNMRM